MSDKETSEQGTATSNRQTMMWLLTCVDGLVVTSVGVYTTCRRGVAAARKYCKLYAKKHDDYSVTVSEVHKDHACFQLQREDDFRTVDVQLDPVAVDDTLWLKEKENV